MSASISFPNHAQRSQGHVDFSWEVARSLAACQGALLLVDASQGVQAQSISVFHVARDKGLTIIPVLNKVRPTAARMQLSRPSEADRLTCPPRNPSSSPNKCSLHSASTLLT